MGSDENKPASASQEVHGQNPAQSPGSFNWLQHPQAIYLLLLLGGGGTLTGVNLLGNGDQAPSGADIARVEAKVASVEVKVDKLSTLVTELRIAIAAYHSQDLKRDP